MASVGLVLCVGGRDGVAIVGGGAAIVGGGVAIVGGVAAQAVCCVVVGRGSPVGLAGSTTVKRSL
jgi:hypothetical protein